VSQRRTGTLSGASSQARRTLPAYARLDPSLELNQGDPPCSSPPWPRRAACSDCFWRRELRVSRHFSTFYEPSVQAMDTQLNALPTLPVLARTVSGGVNSAFLNISQHFTAHLFSPWIPSSTLGIDSEPRRFTEVVLNEQSLPVTGSGRVSRRLLTTPPSSATAGFPVPDRRRATWRPSPSETNSQRQQSGSKGGQDQLCSIPPIGCTRIVVGC